MSRFSDPSTTPARSLAIGPRGHDLTVPSFEAHPWVRGGHRQTIVGRYLPGSRVKLRSTQHVIDADPDDRLSLQESVPPSWTTGRPGVVLVHGLGGCAR